MLNLNVISDYNPPGKDYGSGGQYSISTTTFQLRLKQHSVTYTYRNGFWWLCCTSNLHRVRGDFGSTRMRAAVEFNRKFQCFTSTIMKYTGLLNDHKWVSSFEETDVILALYLFQNEKS